MRTKHKRIRGAKRDVFIARSAKGDKKRHVEQAAREKIEKMGGTFISYNRKSHVCHYLTSTGKKEAKTVFLG